MKMTKTFTWRTHNFMFFGAQSQESEIILAVQFPDCVARLVHQVVDEACDLYCVAVVHSCLQGDAYIQEKHQYTLKGDTRLSSNLV